MALGKRIAMIGSGNVAWHLAPALENAGHIIVEVFSRSKKNASALVDRLYQAEIKEDLDFSDSTAELFIIAVTDDCISEVAQELALPENAIVVHTSGAQSLGELGYTATEAIGVFYPLQTFSKSKKVKFEEIPICIEAEDKDTERVLLTIAKSISNNVQLVSTVDRKALHVAAVFACNFTNHCLTLSEQILNSKKLDFDILKPLIIETINKGLELGPSNAQTGPAKRHDFQTLDHHMEFLSENEELAELYRLFSQNIVDNYPID
ncbi:Rossmann-like and DUF2520 domain-containing protein [Fulvivirga lutea]|uniref:DUF2520 domain-containing protein n=1 Tax=Fulvivirga lutea TaxID=2810512 RepID=A0A974WIK6_9BACT|nr:Rossmann-like and DUF2520 domain-containing protein [Fulvivirga lutea]QSE98423.1 DUF2520 domain-containing protein [Fulvivirga lutea]